MKSGTQSGMKSGTQSGINSSAQPVTNSGAHTGISATVWLVDARTVGAAELAVFATWLGASEAARCERFVRPMRLRQFLIGRALLRQMLAPLLSVSPEQIRLIEQPGQAPQLVCTDSLAMAPGFSLSHSGHWVACAVSAGIQLGFDIEVIDRKRSSESLNALAAHAFDASAVAFLAGLTADARVPAFYRLWSEHEARCKLGAVHQNVHNHVHCISLPHPDLSVALASAVRLPCAPLIERVTLASVSS